MKNIVITGSTRGIGLALTKEFLKAGCNVSLNGRQATYPDSLSDELKPYLKQILYVSGNVQDPAQLEKLWDVSVKHWGSIDCWINNAGQNAPHRLVYETDFAATQAVIATNIIGMINGSQIAAKHMVQQGHGQIWNMEGLGSDNRTQNKTILYGTTKHALTYFTKGLAQEMQRTPVLVGRLSPGMMLTDFIIKDTKGQPAEIITDKQFKFIFNALGDHPETVAKFFVPRILANTKNNAHLVWLTNYKAMTRLLFAPLIKRKLI